MREATTFKEQHGIEGMRVHIRHELLGADATEMEITPERFRGWARGTLQPEEVLTDYRTVVLCRNSLCRAGGLHLGPILTDLAGRRQETASLVERCEGHEGPADRLCQAYFTIEVTIQYTDPAASRAGVN